MLEVYEYRAPIELALQLACSFTSHTLQLEREKACTLWTKTRPFESVFMPPTMKQTTLEADSRLIAARYLLSLHTKPAL